MKPPHERRTALTHLVEAEGVARVNPPMLLEANQYFELAGEEFGRSLLMTVANDGVEYCLRPEFTIPIVSQYVAQGLAGSPVAYGYMGQVFRQDAEEVAERYHEKQALAAAHVPLPTIDLLRLYLSIEGRASVILDEIEDLAQVYKFDLTEPLAALRHHTATLRALAPQCAVTFDAGFSPRLEYYTGIVFEMLGEDGAVLASGGQYDRLLQRLGSSVPVTAAGCAVWVDRVEQEMMGQ